MLQEQIKGLKEKEEGIISQISLIEEEVKGLKAELNVIRKARRSMEKYEEQLTHANGNEELQPVVSY